MEDTSTRIEFPQCAFSLKLLTHLECSIDHVTFKNKKNKRAIVLSPCSHILCTRVVKEWYKVECEIEKDVAVKNLNQSRKKCVVCQKEVKCFLEDPIVSQLGKQILMLKRAIDVIKLGLGQWLQKAHNMPIYPCTQGNFKLTSFIKKGRGDDEAVGVYELKFENTCENALLSHFILKHSSSVISLSFQISPKYSSSCEEHKIFRDELVQALNALSVDSCVLNEKNITLSGLDQIKTFFAYLHASNKFKDKDLILAYELIMDRPKEKLKKILDIDEAPYIITRQLSDKLMCPASEELLYEAMFLS